MRLIAIENSLFRTVKVNSVIKCTQVELDAK